MNPLLKPGTVYPLSSMYGGIIPGDSAKIFGRHPTIVEIEKLVRRVMRTPSTIPLSRECVIGKELVVREMNRIRPRREPLFLIVTYNTLPETLFESELFDHKKDVFTAAES